MNQDHKILALISLVCAIQLQMYISGTWYCITCYPMKGMVSQGLTGQIELRIASAGI